MSEHARYCPCNGDCHTRENPCSMDCFAHHGEMRTIDVGYVHTLTVPGGPCRDDCPHPDHQPTEEPDE